MGLFDKFKKPKTADDFYREYADVVLDYVKKMNECDHLGFEIPDFTGKVASYKRIFELYDELKAFCSTKYGGQEYIRSKFETSEPHIIGNYYSSMKLWKENLDHANYVLCEVVPSISNMAKSGNLLQKDLYDKFAVSKNELKLILDEMEKEKLIKKEKQGNTYLILS